MRWLIGIGVAIGLIVVGALHLAHQLGRYEASQDCARGAQTQGERERCFALFKPPLTQNVQ